MLASIDADANFFRSAAERRIEMAERLLDAGEVATSPDQLRAYIFQTREKRMETLRFYAECVGVDGAAARVVDDVWAYEEHVCSHIEKNENLVGGVLAACDLILAQREAAE